MDRPHAARRVRARRSASARRSRSRAPASCRRATRPAAPSRRGAPAGPRRWCGTRRSRRREARREKKRARTASRRSSSSSRPRAATPRQLDPPQRGQVGRHAAAEVVVDEGELRREHRARVELDLLLEHEPLEHDARGDVAVADRPRERVDGALPDLSGGERADHAGAEQLELADRERRVHRRPGGARPAAELLVAHPQVDADRLALVGVDPRLAERRPAPRPDRVRPQLLRHPPRRERLQLHDLEPLRARLQPLAAARARRRLELELERDPARRNADLRELRTSARMPLRIDRLARTGPSACSCGTFGEVKKTWRIRSAIGREVAPPLRRLAAGVGRVRDRHADEARRAPSAAGRARACSRGTAPSSSSRASASARRRARSARSTASGSRVTETAKSKSRSARSSISRRVGGHGRRPDAVVEVEVEEDGRGAVLRAPPPA